MSAQDEAAGAVPRQRPPRRLSMSRRLSLTFDLPHGGEYYEHVVTADRVGVMFFKAYQLVNVVLSGDDAEIIAGLKDRPVVSFMFEDSPGREAGVELGHVLCKVNGESVVSPRDATEKIGAAQRPMTLFFYVPEWSTIHCAEAELLVKCDTKDLDYLDVPVSFQEWQKKYVVVGGMLGCGNPPKLKMYNSKKDYDTAVLEENASKEILSVKAEEFDLNNIQIMRDRDGDETQNMEIPGADVPLTYIVVVSSDGKRCPLKLASFELSELRQVHDALRQVVKSQEPPPEEHGKSSDNIAEDEEYGFCEDVSSNSVTGVQQKLASLRADSPATDSDSPSRSVSKVTVEHEDDVEVAPKRKGSLSLSEAIVAHEDSAVAKKRGSFVIFDDFDDF